MDQNNTPVLQDSGSRRSFNTGAVRDAAEDKPRPDLICPFAVERLGWQLKHGAAKYAERNWEKGMPQSVILASLERHIMRFKQGDYSEDHLAAIMFNAMALVSQDERMLRGLLDLGLNDLPYPTLGGKMVDVRISQD